MREVMEHEFKNQRSPLPRGLIETASILTTTNLIGNSDMLAVMPTEVAERYEAHGLLACLRYTVRQRLSVYGTIAARDRPAGPAATQLMQFLRSATAEAPQNQKQ